MKAHPKLLSTEIQPHLGWKKSTGKSRLRMHAMHAWMQLFKLEFKSKHRGGALAEYKSLGKVPSDESPEKSLWFCPLSWLEIMFSAPACQKGWLRFWVCTVENRWPHRFGLGDIDTFTFVHLDNQGVEHKFLCFWLRKPKQEAKFIPLIGHPESLKHSSLLLARGCHFHHRSSSLPLVQEQDVETSGAYLAVHRVLSDHVLYWLDQPEAF